MARPAGGSITSRARNSSCTGRPANARDGSRCRDILPASTASFGSTASSATPARSLGEGGSSDIGAKVARLNVVTILTIYTFTMLCYGCGRGEVRGWVGRFFKFFGSGVLLGGQYREGSALF